MFIGQRRYDCSFCYLLCGWFFPEPDGGALTQLPTDEISFRFLFWIVVTLLSYGAGLWLCRQHAKRQQAEPGDNVVAMAAQAILPVGAAAVILLAVGMIAFGFLWDH